MFTPNASTRERKKIERGMRFRDVIIAAANGKAEVWVQRRSFDCSSHSANILILCFFLFGAEEAKMGNRNKLAWVTAIVHSFLLLLLCLNVHMDSNLVICVVTVAILLFMAVLATILVRRYRHSPNSFCSDPESCRPAHSRHWLSIFPKPKRQNPNDTMYSHAFYALSELTSLPPAYLSWSSSSPTQHMLEGYDTRRTTLDETNMDPIQFSLAKQDEADRIWYHRDSTSTFHHNHTKRLSEPVARTSLEYHVW